MPELKSDLALIEQSVRDAGTIARKFYRGSYKKWNKAGGQPVTECDLAIDKFLYERLRTARPDYGWLSEETEDRPEQRNTKTVFVVDPIDGTVALLKGRPHFTICAATVSGGKAAAGAVYNPITGECFSAMAGAGATLNGKKIRVSNRETLEGCRILGPKATLVNAPPSTGPAIAWPDMHVETRSSIAYRLALVACGSFDATVALSAKHDWDLAAADVIVKEAGGLITTHTGACLKYNGRNPVQISVVCAGPALHAQLIERVKDVTLLGR